MRTYLDRLLGQREELRSSAQGLLDHAAAEDRDVTDAENATVEDCYRQVATLDERIEPLQAAELREAAHASRVAELDLATRSARTAVIDQDGNDVEPRTPGLKAYRSVGMWLADWGRRNEDPTALARLERARQEFRVVADQKLADNPGLLPTPILGPIAGTIPALRPFIESTTQRPMPANGSQFSRPKITQHTSVALQATEKTQLASQKLTITSANVAKKTYGGTLDISFQDRDWTDPAILDIAVSDLASIYAQVTDDAAADAFVASTTVTAILAAGADYAATTAAILNAAAAIFAATKRMPDTIWVSPDQWVRFAAMFTPQGLPAFPGMASAGTSMSGNPLGLRLVVDGNFAAGTAIVGCSSYVEHYEQVGGLLSVTEPTILGYTIAWYGYNADYTVDPVAFVRFTAT